MTCATGEGRWYPQGVCQSFQIQPLPTMRMPTTFTLRTTTKTVNKPSPQHLQSVSFTTSRHPYPSVLPLPPPLLPCYQNSSTATTVLPLPCHHHYLHGYHFCHLYSLCHIIVTTALIALMATTTTTSLTATTTTVSSLPPPQPPLHH